MASPTVFTLLDPKNGNLAFKIFPFDGGSHFDHIQRFNYFSILLITHGNAKLKCDFSEHTVGKDYLLAFSPYQPFMLSSKKKLRGVALQFHSDFFCIHKHHNDVACNGVLFNNIYEPPYIIMSAIEMQSFIGLVEQMKTEMQNSAVAQNELLVSYLKIFMVNASRIRIAQYPKAVKNPKAGTEPFILQNLKQAIEKHYKTKHTASDYAKLLHISANALAKISKMYFNKTLTDLIAERITIEAKRELYLTSKSVKQIAYELGFNDGYYFSRFFKKNADVSPQLYRKTVGYAIAEI